MEADATRNDAPFDSVPGDTSADERDENAFRSNGVRPRGGFRPMILVRRLHLYAGLFLLPWVFLYGVTAAIFNNHDWFPPGGIAHHGGPHLTPDGMADFPSPDELADRVLASITDSTDKTVERLPDSPAEYTGDLMYEGFADGRRYVVHIDPLSHTSSVTVQEKRDPAPDLLPKLKNLSLKENPFRMSLDAAQDVLKKAEPETSARLRPLGWTKLNFLATVDGQTARLTYVLKDGHLDASEYRDDADMPLRQFLLRLHTTHGQSPTWTGRMMWSVIVDAMAIAMVAWGLTGLLMWWQLKRTRLVGGVVLIASIATSAYLVLAVQGFYATTRL